MKALITLTWIGLVAVVTCQQIQAERNYELCKDTSIHISSVGQSGTITFSGGNFTKMNPCVLRIQACAACKVELSGRWDTSAFCNEDIKSLQCRTDCYYMYAFDVHYRNETLRYFGSWVKSIEFKSESSSVAIGLCHGRSADHSFNLTYNTTKKGADLKGSSHTSSSVGFIRSPLFPASYAMNSEVYEYSITSLREEDFIRLTFDDWHLSESSSFYFRDSSIHGQVTGAFYRPTVDSTKNKLSFTFHTGASLHPPGQNRLYTGFSLRYQITQEHGVIPVTKCPGSNFYMQTGGIIQFSGRGTNLELHDCIWVVKTMPGYHGTFLKIVKFKTNSLLGYRNDNFLELRSGVTSLGRTVETYDILDKIQDGVGHSDTDGFYIRLKGNFDRTDELVITFNSFRTGRCGSEFYKCDNDMCIDQALVCDGSNNCGDNSDEGHGGCPAGVTYDKDYQYTITISVIVPMVISVFLIMIICLLFVMIRRCRRAHLQAAAEGLTGSPDDRLHTVSEDVNGRSRGGRRRRRHHRMFGGAERDMPPTYDEAMQNPPGWYLNVAFGAPVDPSLPSPPPYSETVEEDHQTIAQATLPPGSPTSTDSSQSELTTCSRNLSESSSSSDEGSTWGNYDGEGEGRRGRLGRHGSSSASEMERPRTRNREVYSRSEQTDSLANSEAAMTDGNVSADGKSEETRDYRVKKTHEKLGSKPGTDLDAFIIPDGPKPGSSECDLSGRNTQTCESAKADAGSDDNRTPSHSRHGSSDSPRSSPGQRENRSKYTNHLEESRRASSGVDGKEVVDAVRYYSGAQTGDNDVLVVYDKEVADNVAMLQSRSPTTQTVPYHDSTRTDRSLDNEERRQTVQAPRDERKSLENLHKSQERMEHLQRNKPAEFGSVGNIASRPDNRQDRIGYHRPESNQCQGNVARDREARERYDGGRDRKSWPSTGNNQQLAVQRDHDPRRRIDYDRRDYEPTRARRDQSPRVRNEHGPHGQRPREPQVRSYHEAGGQRNVDLRVRNDNEQRGPSPRMRNEPSPRKDEPRTRNELSPRRNEPRMRNELSPRRDEPRMRNERRDHSPRMRNERTDQPRMRSEPRRQNEGRNQPRMRSEDRDLSPRRQNEGRNEQRMRSEDRHQPRRQNEGRDQPRRQNEGRNEPRMRSENRDQPRMQNERRDQPRMQNEMRDQPRMRNERTPPKMRDNSSPRMRDEISPRMRNELSPPRMRDNSSAPPMRDNSSAPPMRSETTPSERTDSVENVSCVEDVSESFRPVPRPRSSLISPRDSVPSADDQHSVSPSSPFIALCGEAEISDDIFV